MNYTQIVHAVADEMKRSSDKHGSFNSPLEGVAVIHEEWDEFVHEVRHGSADAATKECIQVAAMAMKWLATFGVTAAVKSTNSANVGDPSERDVQKMVAHSHPQHPDPTIGRPR